MRKIKYKAWNNGSKLIADVLAIDWDEKGNIISCHLKYKKDKTIYKVYPEKDYGDDITLLQYTCLKDKKKKDIYEGYIISAKGHFDGYGWYDTGEHDYDFVAEVKWDNIKLTYTCGGYNLYDLDNVKIIGNIYENPNLLN